MLTVQISYSIGEFERKLLHTILVECLVIALSHEVLEITSSAEFSDHVDVIGCFKDFNHLDDLSMTAFVEEGGFVFELRNCLLSDKFPVDHFDGDLSLGHSVLGSQHTATNTFLDRFGLEFVLVLLAGETLSKQKSVVPLLAHVLRAKVNYACFIGGQYQDNRVVDLTSRRTLLLVPKSNMSFAEVVLVKNLQNL